MTTETTEEAEDADAELKQEPHTEMWRIKHDIIYIINILNKFQVPYC